MAIKIILILAFLVNGSIFASQTTKFLKSKNTKYDKLIQKKYKSYDNFLELDEIPKKVQIALYKRIERSLNIIKKNRNITQKEKLILEAIFQKADEFDLEDYDFDELNEKYELLAQEVKKETFNLKYFASLSILTWNYQITLVDSDGTRLPLYSKERGPSIGLGMDYGNSYWGLRGEAAYAYMTATVGEDSTSVKYNQSDVPVDALFLKLAGYYLPKENVSLGFGPSFVYHSAAYSPTVGGRIIDDNEFTYGYQFSASWMIKVISLELSLGDLRNYKSSFWQLGLKCFF